MLSLLGRVDGGGAVYFARWRRVVKGGGGVLFCQGFDGVADSKNWRIEGGEINGDRVGGSGGRGGVVNTCSIMGGIILGKNIHPACLLRGF